MIDTTNSDDMSVIIYIHIYDHKINPQILIHLVFLCWS